MKIDTYTLITETQPLFNALAEIKSTSVKQVKNFLVWKLRADIKIIRRHLKHIEGELDKVAPRRRKMDTV